MIHIPRTSELYMQSKGTICYLFDFNNTSIELFSKSSGEYKPLGLKPSYGDSQSTMRLLSISNIQKFIQLMGKKILNY